VSEYNDDRALYGAQQTAPKWRTMRELVANGTVSTWELGVLDKHHPNAEPEDMAEALGLHISLPSLNGQPAEFLPRQPSTGWRADFFGDGPDFGVRPEYDQDPPDPPEYDLPQPRRTLSQRLETMSRTMRGSRIGGTDSPLFADSWIVITGRVEIETPTHFIFQGDLWPRDEVEFRGGQWYGLKTTHQRLQNDKNKGDLKAQAGF